jgi:hypothetical protein
MPASSSSSSSLASPDAGGGDDGLSVSGVAAAGGGGPRGPRPLAQALLTAEQAYDLLADKLSSRFSTVRKAFLLNKGNSKPSGEAGSNSIDRKQFRDAVERMGLDMSGEEFRKLWRRFDVSGDGSISYAEFNNQLGYMVSPPCMGESRASSGRRSPQICNGGRRGPQVRTGRRRGLRSAPVDGATRDPRRRATRSAIRTGGRRVPQSASASDATCQSAPDVSNKSGNLSHAPQAFR